MPLGRPQPLEPFPTPPPKAWFVLGTGEWKEWYEGAIRTLASARAQSHTTHTCPNCGSSNRLSESPRHLSCPACGWEVDLRPYRSLPVGDVRKLLQTDLNAVRRQLYQLKYDATYGEIDGHETWDVLKPREVLLQARLDELAEIEGNPPYLLLLPNPPKV